MRYQNRLTLNAIQILYGTMTTAYEANTHSAHISSLHMCKLCHMMGSLLYSTYLPVRESFERIPKIVILLFNFYHRKQNMFCAMLVTYLTSSVNIWAEPELRCVSHIFSFTVSSHAHCIHKIFVHLNEWALIRAHHSSWKIKKIIIINRSRQSHMNMIHVNNNFISACNCILFALDLHIHHTFGHVV